jgi:NADH:ubiquinone oxidoreductase subunit K
LLGLIFSIIALVQINSQVEKQAGWGLALAGLICSAVSLLVGLGLIILQYGSAPANFGWHFGAI